MVERASDAAQISVGASIDTEEGATPQSSAYSAPPLVLVVVGGVGLGVPGDEWVWKEGGGLLGMERMEGAW